MSDDVVIRALSARKGGKLSSLETRQIQNLRKAYGTNNLMTAIRFAKTAAISDVAKMLLQHCGLRRSLPASLQQIMPGEEEAKLLWSPEKFAVACRLAQATASVENEVEDLTESLLSLWRSKIQRESTTSQVQMALRGAIRKYGEPLARRGVEILPLCTSLGDSELISLYKAWVECASRKDWAGAEGLLAGFENINVSATWGIPNPLPMRLERYFIAKANREPTADEAADLWGMLREQTVEQILHAMSSVPAAEFSLHQVWRLITPKELWSPYDLDIEERIDVLFRRKLGRAPTTTELNSMASLYDDCGMDAYGFFDMLYRIPAGYLSSIDSVGSYISRAEEAQQEERDQSEREELEEDLYIEGIDSMNESDHDYYDYSTDDENSLDSDDFMY